MKKCYIIILGLLIILDTVSTKKYKRQASNVVNTSNKLNQNLIVEKHNDMRRELQASNMLAMEWYDDAMHLAEKYLSEKKCDYNKIPSAYKSTSLFRCSINRFTSSGRLLSWNRVIDKWWNEFDNFKFDEEPSGPTDNFTQIAYGPAWKIGCAYKMMNCFGARYHVYVCYYCPGLPKNRRRTPYKQGTNCDDCNGFCNEELCNNPCTFQNKLDNCDNLQKSFDICENPNFEEDAADCTATCKCGDNIYS